MRFLFIIPIMFVMVLAAMTSVKDTEHRYTTLIKKIQERNKK
jgi:hypothetical protein